MNSQTLERMRQMHLLGMYDAFKTSLETTLKENLTQDQFIAHLGEQRMGKPAQPCCGKNRKGCRFPLPCNPGRSRLHLGAGIRPQSGRTACKHGLCPGTKGFVYHRFHRNREKLPGYSARKQSLPGWIQGTLCRYS